MRSAISFLLMICVTSSALSDEVQSETDVRLTAPKALREWVDARAGTGDPVHWIADGGVYAYPSGEKLFGMIGFDSSTVIWPEKLGDDILHLTRKTFAYTDAITGEILTEHDGTPVEPIAYPYQLITYRMIDGIIYGDVEQGAGEQIQKIKSVDGMRVGALGEDTMTVTASVFLDFPLPNGQQYQAWENYDFFIHSGADIDEPHQMSWQRYGALPPWAGSGKAIYHLRSWRVEREDEFPPKLLKWAKAEKPMWLKPPANLDEIRALQQGVAAEAWAK
jgi:hypothetical protein